MMALLHFASQSRANGFDLSGATHSCLPRRLLLDTVFLELRSSRAEACCWHAISKKASKSVYTDSTPLGSQKNTSNTPKHNLEEA